MIRHYLTLEKLTHEFSVLKKCRIVECFTQEKNSLVFALYDGEDVKHLYFSGDTRYGCVYLRRNFNRAGKNSANLIPLLQGQTILDVKIAEADRIIILETNDYFVNIVLFGASKNNVILTDKSYIIVDAFKSAAKLKGSEFSYSTKVIEKPRNDLLISEYLMGLDFTLGKRYISEFLKRKNIDKKLLWAALLEEKKTVLANELTVFKGEILASKEYSLLTDISGNLLFSLIELDGWNVVEKFHSVNIGIERRIRKDLVERNLESKKKIIIKNLNSSLKKTDRAIADIDKSRDNLKRSSDYRLWGEMLMAYPNQKEKPGKSVVLDDWESNKLEIKLDEKLTVNENARRYFKKAGDSERNYEIRKEMLPSLKEKAEKIRLLIEKIESADTLKELKKIIGDETDMDDTENLINSKESKYREFDLGEGYILYVGKNAANNDELTVKFAKPNDMWFHARGSSGSHAVLRLNKDQKPPKYIIKKAAAVAAYYSGAKNAKYVPVSYCLKKFVTKPKGANTGAVVIRREEVVMVEPGLPEIV